MKTHLIHSVWLIVAAGLGFALYCALLASGLFAGSTILFYRGLALAAVAALAAGGIGAVIARKRGTDPLAVAAALTCFSVSACFLVLFSRDHRSLGQRLSARHHRPAGTGRHFSRTTRNRLRQRLCS